MVPSINGSDVMTLAAVSTVDNDVDDQDEDDLFRRVETAVLHSVKENRQIN